MRFSGRHTPRIAALSRSWAATLNFKGGTANIQTIFFDVGNTLRIVLPDQEFIDRAEAGLMELIGTTESHDALFAKLEERWKAYRKQSKTTLLDASEGELWTQYMLPEYDPCQRPQADPPVARP